MQFAGIFCRHYGASRMTRPSTLSFSVIGGLSVHRDGREIELPTSRKTRALLAYLVLTGRPHRRDRLCELFWDRTDDPKGALRWALSKLRPIVNDEDNERILADRERISFALAGAELDATAFRDPSAQAKAASQLAAAGPEPLSLLDGLDLPDNDT